MVGAVPGGPVSPPPCLRCPQSLFRQLFRHQPNMRTTFSRLAESISKRPLNLREAGAELLPPIP
jgi:hypothetical protein